MSTFVLEENIGGRYESVRHFKSTIGAEVYTATDRLLGAKVLIKVVNSARYFRESNVLSLRRACNLVIPHDVYFFDSNHCVLVYPWFDGGDLRGRLRNLGPLSEEETTVLALDLLTALFELHSAGLTHGDLKPENVLVVSSEGHRSFHLSDFGSCAPVGEVLVKAWRAGSPAYEAPEAVVGKKTTKSDLYSLGIVLLEALRAEVPYKGMPKEIFRQAKWELPNLSGIKTDSLRLLIALLIQGDSDNRLQKADDAKSLLKNGIKRVRPIMPRQARRLPAETGSARTGAEEQWMPNDCFQSTAVVLRLLVIGLYLFTSSVVSTKRQFLGAMLLRCGRKQLFGSPRVPTFIS